MQAEQIAKATSRVNMAPQKHKEQDYPRGVWHSYDPRRGQHRMNAYWRDERGPHTRSFYIGHDSSYSPLDMEAAEAAAIAFREEYVACRNTGRRFDPSFIDDWNG